ncbi:MAG: heme-copper oxidase subunit III [Roseiarcus sp.]|jgi:cytochrome c oxidase subunit 3
MTDMAHGADEHAVHEHHWEVSWAPMAIAFGSMFLVPLTFAAVLIYHLVLPGIICAGIGAPLIVAGIARWVYEGATHPSPTASVAPAGIGIFIVGEILIFLGLFAAYWTLRLTSGTGWPPAGTPDISKILPLIMTVILVTSSLTYHQGETRLHEGDQAGFVKWLGITIVVGVLFLCCTVYEYNHLIHEGFAPWTNQYSAPFYTLTGFHASHVFLGLGTFVTLLFAALRSKPNPGFVKVAGIYWHFVDIVWFFVASQVYFW